MKIKEAVIAVNEDKQKTIEQLIKIQTDIIQFLIAQIKKQN
ncbi:hypothetical protein [Spiroplasma endosymbiont of Nebria brevicollis]